MFAPGPLAPLWYPNRVRQRRGARSLSGGRACARGL